MARMVDTDAIIEAMGIRTYMKSEWTPATAWGVPIVEAKPVRHGQWLWVDGVRCSICNYKLQTTGLPSYCPNCGAKMSETSK